MAVIVVEDDLIFLLSGGDGDDVVDVLYVVVVAVDDDEYGVVDCAGSFPVVVLSDGMILSDNDDVGCNEEGVFRESALLFVLSLLLLLLSSSKLELVAANNRTGIAAVQVAARVLPGPLVQTLPVVTRDG